jgi:HlyD family secretion protein
VLCVVAVVLTVGIIILLNVLGGDGESTSSLNYRVSSVSSGEISTTISGSGTLSALESESVTAAAEATVTSVNFEPGDTVAAGEVVMTLTSEELESQLDELNDDLASTRSSLATTKQYLTNRRITATKAGIVKDIQLRKGIYRGRYGLSLPDRDRR